MAHKKKRLSRKEKKEQRRKKMARVRKQQGWKPRRASAPHRQDELLEDMLPLFPMLKEGPISPDDMQQIMLPLMTSEDLIDEPEFEEIIIDPLLCVNTLIEVGQELGIDPEALEETPDEEIGERHMQMLQQTTERLVTDEVRQEIIDALNKLRLRLKRSGRRKDVPRVAGLQSFLQQEDSNEMWSLFGLVRAIVQRSIEAGFELMDASEEVGQDMFLDDDDSSETLLQKLGRSSLARKADAVLNKVPGLSSFMAKQADKAWEEGVDAIYKGQLYLELFTPEELAGGAEIMQEVMGFEPAEETPPEEASLPEITGDKVKTLIVRFDEYIIELFTPERLDRLRTRLNTLLTDRTYTRNWLTFLALLNQAMNEEDALEVEKGFLVRALLGEIRAVYSQEIEEDEN